MSQMSANARSPVIPGLKYRDAPTAIEWLCEAFGFERHLVVPDDRGGITHAELSFGAGMIMLGSSSTGGTVDAERLPAPTAAPGVYVVVDDPDAHCRRARAAGAEIVLDVEDKPYGGRGYGARDPEGYTWSFGSYDPWDRDSGE